MIETIEVPLDLLFELIDDAMVRADMAKCHGDEFIYKCCIGTITDIKEIIEDAGHVFKYDKEFAALND